MSEIYTTVTDFSPQIAAASLTSGRGRPWLLEDLPLFSQEQNQDLLHALRGQGLTTLIDLARRIIDEAPEDQKPNLSTVRTLLYRWGDGKVFNEGRPHLDALLSISIKVASAARLPSEEAYSELLAKAPLHFEESPQHGAPLETLPLFQGEQNKRLLHALTGQGVTTRTALAKKIVDKAPEGQKPDFGTIKSLLSRWGGGRVLDERQAPDVVFLQIAIDVADVAGLTLEEAYPEMSKGPAHFEELPQRGAPLETLPLFQGQNQELLQALNEQGITTLAVLAKHLVLKAPEDRKPKLSSVKAYLSQWGEGRVFNTRPEQWGALLPTSITVAEMAGLKPDEAYRDMIGENLRGSRRVSSRPVLKKVARPENAEGKKPSRKEADPEVYEAAKRSLSIKAEEAKAAQGKARAAKPLQADAHIVAARRAAARAEEEVRQAKARVDEALRIKLLGDIASRAAERAELLHAQEVRWGAVQAAEALNAAARSGAARLEALHAIEARRAEFHAAKALNAALRMAATASKARADEEAKARRLENRKARALEKGSAVAAAREAAARAAEALKVASREEAKLRKKKDHQAIGPEEKAARAEARQAVLRATEVFQASIREVTAARKAKAPEVRTVEVEGREPPSKLPEIESTTAVVASCSPLQLDAGASAQPMDVPEPEPETDAARELFAELEVVFPTLGLRLEERNITTLAKLWQGIDKNLWTDRPAFDAKLGDMVQKGRPYDPEDARFLPVVFPLARLLNADGDALFPESADVRRKIAARNEARHRDFQELLKKYAKPLKKPDVPGDAVSAGGFAALVSTLYPQQPNNVKGRIRKQRFFVSAEKMFMGHIPFIKGGALTAEAEELVRLLKIPDAELVKAVPDLKRADREPQEPEPRHFEIWPANTIFLQLAFV